MGKIAVIGGNGNLPSRICSQLDSIGLPYELIHLINNPRFEIGQIGKMIDHIHSLGITKVVFCGGVKRPSLLKLKLDALGKKWLKKLGYKAFLGDDALLKGIKKLLKEENLEIISPQSILNTLLTKPGILTTVHPGEQDIMDIARGVFVLKTLSKADVGQAVVVQEGVVIGIEAIEGTRNLIMRAKDFKLTENGGVLVKTSKVGQALDIDLPTIGEQTILECIEAKLNGIALESNKSQIIDFEKTIELANEHNIFIMGIQ